MYGLSWITMCLTTRGGDSPIICTSDAVMSKNYWRITQRVTKDIVIRGNPYVHRGIDENYTIDQ